MIKKMKVREAKENGETETSKTYVAARPETEKQKIIDFEFGWRSQEHQPPLQNVFCSLASRQSTKLIYDENATTAGFIHAGIRPDRDTALAPPILTCHAIQRQQERTGGVPITVKQGNLLIVKTVLPSTSRRATGISQKKLRQKLEQAKMEIHSSASKHKERKKAKRRRKERKMKKRQIARKVLRHNKRLNQSEDDTRQ